MPVRRMPFCGISSTSRLPIRCHVGGHVSVNGAAMRTKEREYLERLGNGNGAGVFQARAAQNKVCQAHPCIARGKRIDK